MTSRIGLFPLLYPSARSDFEKNTFFSKNKRAQSKREVGLKGNLSIGGGSLPSNAEHSSSHLVERDSQGISARLKGERTSMKPFFLALLILIGMTSNVLADTVTVSAILASPASYDGKHVTVSGTVSKLVRKTSAKGNAYETFSFCDGGCINVFAFGAPASSEGVQLTVNGTYSAVKHTGQYTFHNEIEADDASP